MMTKQPRIFSRRWPSVGRDGSAAMPFIRGEQSRRSALRYRTAIMPRRLMSPIWPIEVVPVQLVVAAKRIFSVWWALNAAARPGEDACATSEH